MRVVGRRSGNLQAAQRAAAGEQRYASKPQIGFLQVLAAAIPAGMVALAGKLKHTINVIISITIYWKQVSSSNGVNGQRVNVFSRLSTERGDEYAGGIHLMTAQFRHQSTSGSIP